MTSLAPLAKPDAPRRLSLRAPLDLLFLFCCVLLAADVLVPEVFGSGKTKDYPLWYWAGQQVLHGGPLYPATPIEYFDYIYPPPPAILLAIPSWFGKILLYVVLSILNVLAWWYTGTLSQVMAGSGRKPGPWLEALPAVVTVPFVFDMFDLGQPNLVLLAMVLFGFWSLRHQRSWLAGFVFALATVIKVFPIAVLPYLLWRRKWVAAASMIAFTGILLYLVPAPIRGFERNAAELAVWYQGMVGTRLGEGLRPARRAELVVGQPVADRRHAPPGPPDQLQSGQSQKAATHDERHRRRLQDGELDRAGALGPARARLRRGHAAAGAADGALGCRGASASCSA